LKLVPNNQAVEVEATLAFAMAGDTVLSTTPEIVMKMLHQPSQIAHATVDILVEVAAVGHAEPLGTRVRQWRAPAQWVLDSVARRP
jgi:citrate lyase alpha subunit